jgi:hypothetical protein
MGAARRDAGRFPLPGGEIVHRWDWKGLIGSVRIGGFQSDMSVVSNAQDLPVDAPKCRQQEGQDAKPCRRVVYSESAHIVTLSLVSVKRLVAFRSDSDFRIAVLGPPPWLSGVRDHRLERRSYSPVRVPDRSKTDPVFLAI